MRLYFWCRFDGQGGSFPAGSDTAALEYVKTLLPMNQLDSLYYGNDDMSELVYVYAADPSREIVTT